MLGRARSNGFAGNRGTSFQSSTTFSSSTLTCCELIEIPANRCNKVNKIPFDLNHRGPVHVLRLTAGKLISAQFAMFPGY